VQTHDFYQAADGTNASITEGNAFVVGLRNAIVVVDDAGNGELVASVANYTDEAQSVTLVGKDGDSPVFTTSVDLTPGQVVKIGPATLQDLPEGQSETLVSVPDASDLVGTNLQIEVSLGGQTETATLPVTGTNLEYYKGGSTTGAQG
jgi:hypothetical protein